MNENCVCKLKSSRFEVILLPTQRVMHFGVTVLSVPNALTLIVTFILLPFLTVCTLGIAPLQLPAVSQHEKNLPFFFNSFVFKIF